MFINKFTNVHINILTDAIKNSQVRVYAGDMVPYSFSKDPRLLERKLNKDLLRVAHWLRENKLTLNLDKTMVIVSNRKLADICLFALSTFYLLFSSLILILIPYLALYA